MFLIVNKHLVARHYLGFAFWPFVFIKNNGLRYNSIFLNHERIHLKQQLELLLIPFYIWYLLEFLIRYFYYRNVSQAYLNISFEKEAYSNELNADYLKTRKMWSFLKYL